MEEERNCPITLPYPDIHKQNSCCSYHSTMCSHLLESHQDKTHEKVRHKLCSNTSTNKTKQEYDSPRMAEIKMTEKNLTFTQNNQSTVT